MVGTRMVGAVGMAGMVDGQGGQGGRDSPGPQRCTLLMQIPMHPTNPTTPIQLTFRAPPGASQHLLRYYGELGAELVTPSANKNSSPV